MEKKDPILTAEYILHKSEEINHLKVQKILYFLEGYHLAVFGKSLIEGQFQAWKYGPVVPEVYQQYKTNSILYNNIKKQELSDCFVCGLSGEQLWLVNYVIDVCNKFDADMLRDITHQQIPWVDARQGLNENENSNRIISKKQIQQWFKKELVDGTSAAQQTLFNFKKKIISQKLNRTYQPALQELAK